ncbi:MAG: hypothetical protein J6A59_07390 [Lachnospiraceae bacterium]|nr:hypothetical protein [Lachnospiraceae bacterium]
MSEKIYIRKLIDEYKIKYNSTFNFIYLIDVAILKGVYLAIGGTKGIPLNPNMTTLVTTTRQIYEYRIKSLTCKNDTKLKLTRLIQRELAEYDIRIEVDLDNVECVATIISTITSLKSDIINIDTLYTEITNILALVERQEFK